MTTAELEQPARAIGPFDEESFATLAAMPGLLQTKREEAFRAYRDLPVPTDRDEAWRKTGLSLFPFDRVAALPLLQPATELGSDPWDEAFDVVVSVDDEHYSIQDRSGVLAGQTIRVMSLTEAAEQVPELLETFLQTRALPPASDKLTALNGAFWNVGFLVHIPDDVKLERGILFRYRHEQPGTALVPRLLVVAGARSEAQIVERFVSPDGQLFQAVAAKELFVGEAGRLKMVSLQEWGDQATLIDNDMAVVERDGQVDWITLNFGTRVSKMNFGSDVAGPGASAELDGIYFATGDQHLEQTTLQIHSSADTYSRLLYKGAVKDRGHSVYRGIIQAKPKCVRVDAYQTNNNLVLTDGAKAESIPGLLIDADDLKCSHGATIGNVDEEQVFYLRSRGLSEQDARQIVIMGYFDEIVGRIPHEFLKERVHAHIERKLQGLL